MLNTIKGMILEKQECLETAQLLFEDATQGGLDDLIILNEASDLPKEDEEEEIESQPEDKEDNEDEPEENGDIENTPIDDPKEDETDPEEDDILGGSIDNEDIQPTLGEGDDLPPVGNAEDDFLNISLDMRSNTLTDILPVPPDNAGEALADDILSTRIDSGFEEEAPSAGVQPGGFPMDENPDDILNESADIEAEYNKAKKAHTEFSIYMSKKYSDDKTKAIDPEDMKKLEKLKKEHDRLNSKRHITKDGKIEFKESVDSFLEAITLDGGGEEKPTDGTEGTSESTPEEPGDPPAEEGGENEVTSAVKDKVAEADAPIEGTPSNKDDILKKLGSITKSLEDAKRAVMSTIQ